MRSEPCPARVAITPQRARGTNFGLAVCRTGHGIRDIGAITDPSISRGTKMPQIRFFGHARYSGGPRANLAAIVRQEKAGYQVDFASCRLYQSMEAFAVVRQTHQLPFTADFLHAPQHKPPEAHDLLDDPECRLDRLLTQAV